MLDIQLIRREPGAVREGLARRGADLAPALDRVIELDTKWRSLRAELEELRAEQNRASKGRKGPPTPEEREQLASLSARGRTLSDEENAVRVERDRELASLPSLPSPEAPDEDTVMREVGEAGSDRSRSPRARRRPDRHGARRAHVGLAVRLPARRSGDARVRARPLRRSRSCAAEGFEPVIPPVLVREHALYGTGMLPDTEQQIYRLAEDDLYLAGTSEVPLASLHRARSSTRDALPIRYAGFSPCFRREAGAAGKDTRGIFRVHQFDKVEMFSFVAPEEAPGRARAAAGDRGGDPPGARDPLPRGRRSRSTTSAPRRRRSTTARRGCPARAATASSPRARTRPTTRPGGWTSATGPRTAGRTTLYTLNGTAVAVGRTIIALLENGQQDDGSVRLPGRARSGTARRRLLAPAATERQSTARGAATAWILEHDQRRARRAAGRDLRAHPDTERVPGPRPCSPHPRPAGGARRSPSASDDGARASASAATSSSATGRLTASASVSSSSA